MACGIKIISNPSLDMKLSTPTDHFTYPQIFIPVTGVMKFFKGDVIAIIDKLRVNEKDYFNNLEKWWIVEVMENGYDLDKIGKLAEELPECRYLTFEDANKYDKLCSAIMMEVPEWWLDNFPPMTRP